MIPFPGESAPLDWANVTAGAPFADDGDAIRYRAGSATLTAGDAFVAGFFDHRYLEAGADAVFSVAIEHVGGSGTLALSGGPDAAWSLLDGPASTYDLGSHAVSGTGTLVVALPWVTVADYLTEAVETAVRVECTSGSVVVQQVKLRIWPPTGAAGGWSDPYTQPAQTRAPDVITEASALVTSAASQADLRAALAAQVTTSTSADPNYITSGSMLADSATPAYGGEFGAAYITRTPGAVTGPGFEEEAWIAPPMEVWSDAAVRFQPVGTDTYAWSQGHATVILEPTVTDGTNAYPVDGLFHIDATDTTGPEPAGTAFTSFVVGSPVATVEQSGNPLPAPGVEYATVTLPEFDDVLRVTIWHDGHFADVAEVGGTQARLANGLTTDEVTFTPLAYLWTAAPYRYWSPAVVQVSPHLIFWRHDDLGAGASLVFQPGTRQSTGLVFANN